MITQRGGQMLIERSEDAANALLVVKGYTKMKRIVAIGATGAILALSGCTLSGQRGNPVDSISMPGFLAMSGKVNYLEAQIPPDELTRYLENKNMMEALGRAYQNQLQKYEQTPAPATEEKGVNFEYPAFPENDPDFRG